MTHTIFYIIVPVLSLILLTVNFVLAVSNPYKEKSTPFECGIHSFLSQNRTQFTISFFIFGILFLIFDLEILLVYPFVTSSAVNSTYGLYNLLIFVLILALGFVFELGKKALRFDIKEFGVLYNNTITIKKAGLSLNFIREIWKLFTFENVIMFLLTIFCVFIIRCTIILTLNLNINNFIHFVYVGIPSWYAYKIIRVSLEVLYKRNINDSNDIYIKFRSVFTINSFLTMVCLLPITFVIRIMFIKYFGPTIDVYWHWLFVATYGYFSLNIKAISSGLVGIVNTLYNNKMLTIIGGLQDNNIKLNIEHSKLNSNNMDNENRNEEYANSGYANNGYPVYTVNPADLLLSNNSNKVPADTAVNSPNVATDSATNTTNLPANPTVNPSNLLSPGNNVAASSATNSPIDLELMEARHRLIKWGGQVCRHWFDNPRMIAEVQDVLTRNLHTARGELYTPRGDQIMKRTSKADIGMIRKETEFLTDSYLIILGDSKVRDILSYNRRTSVGEHHRITKGIADTRKFIAQTKVRENRLEFKNNPEKFKRTMAEYEKTLSGFKDLRTRNCVKRQLIEALEEKVDRIRDKKVRQNNLI